MNKEFKTCEECTSNPAEFLCKECEESMCKDCFETIHKGGKRRDHIGKSLLNEFSNFESISIDFPNPAPIKTIDTCHKQHSAIQNSDQKTIVIYWDLYKNICPIDKIKETVQKFKKISCKVKKIKAFGKEFEKFRSFLAENEVEFCINERLKDEESMILDISAEFTHSNILLVSSRAYQFKPHLLQLLSSGFHEIKILQSFADEKEISVNEILNKSSSEKNGHEEVYRITRRRAAASEDSLEITMISYLRQQAAEGVIIHELDDLAFRMKKFFDISLKSAHDLIEAGVQLGRLNCQKKKIGNELTLISLKIEKIDAESLIWVLRSLKNDQMIPTEKAIQSRIKEVLDLKVTNSQWGNIVDMCYKNQRHNNYYHCKASSEASNTALFSKKPQKHGFCIKKIRDPILGSENLVIYPINEE